MLVTDLRGLQRAERGAPVLGCMLGGDEACAAGSWPGARAWAWWACILASVSPVARPACIRLSVWCLRGWLARLGWRWSRALRASGAVPAVHGHHIWLPFHAPGLSPPAGRIYAQRHRQRGAGDLVLFFVQDRLQAPAAVGAAVAGSYFLSAALSIPLWLAPGGAIGLARSWLAGILLAVAVFVWATQLGAGDSVAFLVVCALSGVALGTDLALPGALLAGVIANSGRPRARRGRVLWLVELCHQAEPGAGRRAWRCPCWPFGLCARYARCARAAGPECMAYCLLPCLLKLGPPGAVLHRHPTREPHTMKRRLLLAASTGLASTSAWRSVGCKRRHGIELRR
jgi:GPH family glycoside/pentoside/hexuronide:cation symporter